MGYQVGNRCFESKELAENHYFSLVVPTFKADGTLLQPKYNGKNWELDGKTIQAHLPQCDPVENFKTGTELGWLIFSIMAALYTIHVIKGLLK